MSIEAISAVLNHSAAHGTTKLVLMGIAWHTGDDPTIGAWPSQELLAEYANASIRQVRRCLIQLEEMGEIEIGLHAGIGYRADRKTNRYYIRLDCPDTCDNTIQHHLREDIQGITTGHPGYYGRTFKVKELP